ncbi:MAG: FAD-binding oxidoreductase [Peptococcaceae bacterium]
MLDQKLINELKKAVGSEKVFASKEDLVCYSYDATSFSYMPDLVVSVNNTQEVSEVMKIAYRYEVPVVPRGGGSNLCGGTVPVKGGIILDLAKMDEIIEIDIENLVAVCQPGVVTAEFQTAVEKTGLFYPPDPQSMAMSTMGGNVATNAGGPRCFKYGVTRDYLLGLEVVLADGRIIKTGGKTIKNVSGYDLTRLFAGSEGTLGVVTEITVRLIPLPEAKRTALAIFDELEKAAEAVSGIIKKKIVPTTLELMDQETMKLIEASKPVGLPTDADSAVLIEVDGSNSDVDKQIKQVAEVCREFGARDIKVAETPEDAAKLWAGRKSAFGVMALSAPTVFTEDATVPRSLLAPMVKEIKNIARKYELKIPVLGHTGDGNLHPIICFDERNKDELARVEKAIDEIFALAIKYGGTLSGEHGIGIAKQKYIPWEFGEDGLAVLQSIKDALDPKNILNPGKVFLRSEQYA